MGRLTLVIFTILSGTLAGIFLLVVLATPALANNAWKLAPWAVALGVVVALPISRIVAGKILEQTKM
jgi:DMSO reductase anchor subunit